MCVCVYQVLEFGHRALQAAQLVPDRGQAGPIQDLLRLVGSEPQPTQMTEEASCGSSTPEDPWNQSPPEAGHP